MRSIQGRVWDTKEERWLSTPDISYIIQYHGFDFSMPDPEFSELVVCLRINKKDTDDRWIHEGDLVVYKLRYPDGEVKYDSVCIKWDGENDRYVTPWSEATRLGCTIVPNSVRITGSIFDTKPHVTNESK